MTQQAPNVRDASLKVSTALPAAASTTVNGAALDAGPVTGNSTRTELSELLLTAPAVTTTMLPDTKTITYSLQMATDAAFTSPVTLAGSCIVQTGAATAGAAKATFRQKLPSNGLRYIRAVAVSGANVTDSSAVKMTLEVLV